MVGANADAGDPAGCDLAARHRESQAVRAGSRDPVAPLERADGAIELHDPTLGLDLLAGRHLAERQVQGLHVGVELVGTRASNHQFVGHRRIVPRGRGPKANRRTLPRQMRTATLDRILAVLVVVMAGTGLLVLKAGSADAGWVFTIHALVGGALLLATLLKARRSLPPAIRAGHTFAVALALVVTVAIAGALAAGYLWVASGRLLAIGPWTLLSWHAWFGLALVPLVV